MHVNKINLIYFRFILKNTPFLVIKRNRNSLNLPFQQASVKGVSSLLPEGTLTCAPRSNSKAVVS